MMKPTLIYGHLGSHREIARAVLGPGLGNPLSWCHEVLPANPRLGSADGAPTDLFIS